jgi:hypothetical protein
MGQNQSNIKVSRNHQFDTKCLTVYQSPFPKKRYGPSNDGGYVMADLPMYDLLIGAGVGGNIIFEIDLCNKYPNTLCVLFDGTVQGLPPGQTHENIHFIKKNIGPVETPTETNLHHYLLDYSNICLKMDIEGAEFSWLETLNDEQLSKFSQIVIEFHFPFTQRHQLVFEALNRSHYLIHFHANNCVQEMTIHQGIAVPNLFECTYVNKKYFTEVPTENGMFLPTSLDSQNCDKRRDYDFDYEPFVFKGKQIIIKMFADYTTSSEQLKTDFELSCAVSQYPSFYGINKRYLVTANEDYTHAIVINTCMPKLRRLPKENILGLAWEPLHFLNMTPEFVEYAKRYIGRYYISHKGSLPAPFIEHHAFLKHSNPVQEITTKPKLMSIIVSEKKKAPGHKYRHQLVQQIIRDRLPIDIYGRGSHLYNYEHIQGSFTDETIPFRDYLFSICIENYCENHYISEKLLTPLMYNCKPLYFGCKNVSSYFKNIITLTGNVQQDMNTIKTVLENPEMYYEKTFTLENRHAANLLEHLPLINW